MVDATRSELYGYDALNQLTSFARGTLNSTKDAIAGMPSATQSWNFDPLGNWDAVTTDGVTETRDHNAQNELTTAGSSGLTYDNNGNMTTDQAGRQFVWDAWNRLVEVKDSGGTTIKTHTYDALNRRVTETVSSTTTVFYYSTNWQVIQEQVAGVTTQQYVWSPVYVDALIFRERDTDADGILDERLWAVQDANFNVVALTDDSGAAVERYQQTPFGVVTVLDASGTVLTASAYGWVYTHQGLRFDADAGLFDNRWRWYSPTLGRFVSVDPLGFEAQDENMYRVESNNPAALLDPTGLDPAATLLPPRGTQGGFPAATLMPPIRYTPAATLGPPQPSVPMNDNRQIINLPLPLAQILRDAPLNRPIPGPTIGVWGLGLKLPNKTEQEAIIGRIVKKVSEDLAKEFKDKQDPDCGVVMESLEKALKAEGLEMLKRIDVPRDSLKRLGISSSPTNAPKDNGNTSSLPFFPETGLRIERGISPIVKPKEIGVRAQATFTQGALKFAVEGTYKLDMPYGVGTFSGSHGSAGIGITLTYCPK